MRTHKETRRIHGLLCKKTYNYGRFLIQLSHAIQGNFHMTKFIQKVKKKKYLNEKQFYLIIKKMSVQIMNTK